VEAKCLLGCEVRTLLGGLPTRRQIETGFEFGSVLFIFNSGFVQRMLHTNASGYLNCHTDN
jgi:hypothetical protein